MDSNSFLDSSVILYAFDESEMNKTETAFKLIQAKLIVSPQVLFETLFVLLRKVKLHKDEALNFINFLQQNSSLQTEDQKTVDFALRILKKHLLQTFDSKIVASALVAGCTTLYSEDMQHGLVIENSLTIINPFL